MILLIDTAGEEGRLALFNASGVLMSERVFLLRSSLSEELLSEVSTLLEQGNLQKSDLSGILCVRGPGHFTSIRLGVLASNALAFALTLPIVGVLVGHEEQGIQKLIAGNGDTVVLPEYDAPPDIR